MPRKAADLTLPSDCCLRRRDSSSSRSNRTHSMSRRTSSQRVYLVRQTSYCRKLPLMHGLSMDGGLISRVAAFPSMMQSRCLPLWHTIPMRGSSSPIPAATSRLWTSLHGEIPHPRWVRLSHGSPPNVMASGFPMPLWKQPLSTAHEESGLQEHRNKQIDSIPMVNETQSNYHEYACPCNNGESGDNVHEHIGALYPIGCYTTHNTNHTCAILTTCLHASTHQRHRLPLTSLCQDALRQWHFVRLNGGTSYDFFCNRDGSHCPV